MNDKERAVMQQALEALEEATSYTSCESWSPSMTDDCNKAITALREMLDHSADSGNMVVGWDRVKPEVIASDPLYQQGFVDGVEEGRNQGAEQAEQEPEYDLSNVIHLTHNKAKHIIKSRGYSVTGFVLTREDGGKCIVDMSAVRWFDDKLVFQRMMHSDTPKEWLSPPVEHVKQEPVAWMHKCGDVCSAYDKEHMFGLDYFNIPLYAAPQPVKEVELTDEEIAQAVGSPLDEVYLADFRSVIAKYKEKNTC